MLSFGFRRIDFLSQGSLVRMVVAGALVFGVASGASAAQSDSSAEQSSSCTLKNHVYTCDGAAFQKALAAARTVAIETHNADGVARGRLSDFVTEKLHKTLASEGQPADLVFLLIPINEDGNVGFSSTTADLGTLRIYSATPQGVRSQLLWAETYSGSPDMPWPAVVRGVILQFQSRFHIK